MKIRSAKLVDRWNYHSGSWMTVQTPRGQILEIRVRDQHMAEASRVWEGSTVRYAYRGGRPFYLSQDEVAAKEWED